MWSLLVNHIVPSEMETGLWRGHDPAEMGEFADFVDPLLAAINHNKDFSLLLKLPDEMLLKIVHFLQLDIPSIYCLRRVCRRLRCLIDDKTIDSPYLWVSMMPQSGTHMLYPDRFVTKENTQSSASWLPPRRNAMQEFNATIRKQTLCEPCQAAHQEKMLPNGCVFKETPERYIHCAGCEAHHTSYAFSHTQRQRAPENRICIGREGDLRLCKHVSIKWADIEAHLVESRGKRNFLEAVSDFHVVCKHPSHNFPCKSTSRVAPSEASCNDQTRPCARLHFNRFKPLDPWRYSTQIWLVMCWKPFSSSKSLTAPENGKIEATKLRELFREYGKDAARYIVPGPSQNPLPEMLCFDPDKCGHILYRNGKAPLDTSFERLWTPHPSSKNGPVTMTEVALDEDHNDPSRFAGLGWTDHYVEFDEARGQSGIYVYECDEKHHGEGSTRCLMTSYRRTISLGHIDRLRPWPAALNPNHQWFHAIDQGSYPSMQAEDGGLWSKVLSYFQEDDTKSRPSCRDTACRNYYQSPGPLHGNDMQRHCGMSYFPKQYECCHSNAVMPRLHYLRLCYHLRNALGMTLLGTAIDHFATSQ
ncbi:hypothetical protein F5883DRAFT_522236 [Diaporthe sp. PMI_573]|nr:hypothetical protein F5883DRAFT_522236 [Diaporthaceae sp. PMI_573]